MKELQPHQQRVVNEATELKTKADDLVNFICINPIFKTLSLEEQDRLRRQAGLMCQYYEVLEERINAF